ncbi:unnamed protein product [Rhizophagus irregularis]|nr:unnamed protein product [Rhizophagus irregularis]
MHEILVALWVFLDMEFIDVDFGFGSTFQSEDLPALLWKWLQQFFCENEQDFIFILAFKCVKIRKIITFL